MVGGLAEHWAVSMVSTRAGLKVALSAVLMADGLAELMVAMKGGKSVVEMVERMVENWAGKLVE